MSEIDNPKALFQATCSSNSEPYALQNIGDMMSPEFSENCIIILDPGMPIHNKAYVIIDFNDELYFRQSILENDEKLLRCLNPLYDDIKLDSDFKIRGCITQQKQRKQRSLHYYLPDQESGEMTFISEGKKKDLTRRKLELL